MITHVISSLLKKRVELSKQLVYHETRRDQATAAVQALDATLWIYDPGYMPPAKNDIRRAPTRNRYFDIGELP